MEFWVILAYFSSIEDVEKFIYMYTRSYGSKDVIVSILDKGNPKDVLPFVKSLYGVSEDKEALKLSEDIVSIWKQYRNSSKGNSGNVGLNVLYTGCAVSKWQWGNDATIPAGCDGADRCWGTVLGATYDPNMDDKLISPTIDASGWDVVELSFNHYYDTEAGVDEGFVLCSPDGGATWIQVAGPYSGNSGAWLNETVDITVCASANMKVAFHFTSDGSIQNQGWYIDDVTVVGKSITSSSVLYATSFEGADDGDLVPVTIGGGSTAPWQRGNPTSGPGGALYGANVWATNLAGDYNANTDEAIQKQNPINLPLGFDGYEMSFYHWWDTETGFDSGWVEISTDNGATWNKITPSFRGHDKAWFLTKIDLSAYAGQSILFRFRFKSDGSIQYPGWYIDSVRIWVYATSAPNTIVAYNFDANDGGFVGSAAPSDPYQISNGYLEWWVDIKTTSDLGTYTARTGALHTYPNITLLYGAQFTTPSAWSSWTTIHSLNTNTDYTGQTATPPAGFTQLLLKNYASQVICGPNYVEFIYDIVNGADNLTVKERFWVQGTGVNGSYLYHRTVVINNSPITARIGVRWEYDTHVDTTDHPAQYQCDYAGILNCGPQIQNPVQVGPPVPATFKYLRESDADPPSGTKFHVFAVNTSYMTPPDYVYHTRWPNADGNTWTYTLSTDDITVQTGLDNAFVYFWDPVNILPGDSISYEHYIGSPIDPTPLANYEDADELRIRYASNGIFLENLEGTMEYKLYDVLGRLISTGKLTSRRNFISIERRGIYVLEANGRKYRIIMK